MAFADVDSRDYVALVIPGGRAPEYIRNDADAQRIVRHFMTGDLPVAQLCHGPLITAAAGALDGQLVSGRAWPDHPAWMREFMEILRSKAPV